MRFSLSWNRPAVSRTWPRSNGYADTPMSARAGGITAAAAGLVRKSAVPPTAEAIAPAPAICSS